MNAAPILNSVAIIRTRDLVSQNKPQYFGEFALQSSPGEGGHLGEVRDTFYASLCQERRWTIGLRTKEVACAVYIAFCVSHTLLLPVRCRIFPGENLSAGDVGKGVGGGK